MNEKPEKKSPTEALDIEMKIEETVAGKRKIDSRSYPYFSPDYALHFTHIGTEKQLFLDNFILDELEGVERVIVKPTKYDTPLLGWTDLPWEKAGFNPLVSAALKDPDDGMFKMWYVQTLTGDPFNKDQVLCYAESRDAYHWEKPLSEKCLPFGEHKATNIVCRDVAASGLVLNKEQSDPERKFLLLYCPYADAKKRGQPILSRVAASPDGVRWQVISEDVPERHQHESKIIWILLLMLAAVSCKNEQTIHPEEYLTAHREGVEKIDEGVYRVGLVTVDANKETVSFDARINMEAGLIEYLICAEWGKLHESVLVTNANPLDIQLGLLALGLKYGGGLTYQGDPAQGKGDPVRIFVQWDDKGKTQKVRGEQFVLNRTRDTAMEETDWTFTGSVILENGFAAQTYGLIVATYNDPYAILNNPLPSRADDEILFVNSRAVPPVGTPVTVILEAGNGSTRSE